MLRSNPNLFAIMPFQPNMTMQFWQKVLFERRYWSGRSGMKGHPAVVAILPSFGLCIGVNQKTKSGCLGGGDAFQYRSIVY
jgi:hypothetical protein